MTKAVAAGALLVVDVQNALSDDSGSEESAAEEPPSSAQLSDWACAAYSAVRDDPAELTIRLCCISEIVQLNRDFRNKQGATNVLSFPVALDFTIPDESDERLGPTLLGDVVICHSVIIEEAAEQGKSVNDHYAHMVTHGVLHLCGYDHQDDITALEMESLETQILARQHIADPYN